MVNKRPFETGSPKELLKAAFVFKSLEERLRLCEKWCRLGKMLHKIRCKRRHVHGQQVAQLKEFGKPEQFGRDSMATASLDQSTDISPAEVTVRVCYLLARWGQSHHVGVREVSVLASNLRLTKSSNVIVNLCSEATIKRGLDFDRDEESVVILRRK